MPNVIPMQIIALTDTFEEAAYLASNPDVAAAVGSGAFKSGKEHFDLYGRNESRPIREDARRLIGPRKQKLDKIRHLLRNDMPVIQMDDAKLDYLSDELREATKIVDTNNVSSNGYDAQTLSLIEKHKDGVILDCGCGRRQDYYQNVVNFEIVDYDTTDVLGVGESLPFKDNSFDAVFSIAVLEHVRDPFTCAKEISRVLKPGGDLYCSIPFLQPYHGYPHHYFNATHQGIQRLFEDELRIEKLDVPTVGHPAFTLHWFLSSWRRGIAPDAAALFDRMTVSEIIALGPHALASSGVSKLRDDGMKELACSFTIEAVKP